MPLDCNMMVNVWSVSRLHPGESSGVGGRLPAEAGCVSGSGPHGLHHLRGLPRLRCGHTPHRRIRRFLEQQFPKRTNTRSWGHIHTVLFSNYQVAGLHLNHFLRKRGRVKSDLQVLLAADIEPPADFTAWWNLTSEKCPELRVVTEPFWKELLKTLRTRQSPWNEFLTFSFLCVFCLCSSTFIWMICSEITAFSLWFITRRPLIGCRFEFMFWFVVFSRF